MNRRNLLTMQDPLVYRLARPVLPVEVARDRFSGWFDLPATPQQECVAQKQADATESVAPKSQVQNPTEGLPEFVKGEQIMVRRTAGSSPCEWELRTFVEFGVNEYAPLVAYCLLNGWTTAGVTEWFNEWRLPTDAERAQFAPAQADGWVEWKGGHDCPVPYGTRIEIRARDGGVWRGYAPLASWQHAYGAADIVAYRVLP